MVTVIVLNLTGESTWGKFESRIKLTIDPKKIKILIIIVLKFDSELT
jgi:hypothetical protein